MRDNRGFTLIEVLVVLVIIGVIVGLASIALGDNRAEELQREARRLQAVLTLAAEEAIVKSRELGVRFDSDGYRFFIPSDEQAWVPVEHDREFAARQLPRPLELTLLTDARAVRSNNRDGNNATPHVYFFTTGELYPAF
ncbi:MAG TPA: type II secretion system minor pseudopilin GspH, partial [Gammaproteobacteria bacterium]|nr:type II secretion system minor pseudopilin GspH [Gammaproteobacteria bacterium]